MEIVADSVRIFGVRMGNESRSLGTGGTRYFG